MWIASISLDSPTSPSNIIKDGVDGYLISLGDVVAMANKICYLIEHDKKRKLMGIQADQNIQRFSSDSIMALWFELFQELNTKYRNA